MFMTLEELLWVVNENTIVLLYNANQEEIGLYDGHSSIEECYLDYAVIDIFGTNAPNTIGIEIDYMPY